MTSLKIFVLSILQSGHINPLLPILENLKHNNENIHFIVYLIEEYRNKFEKMGAEFRLLNDFNLVDKVEIKPMDKKKTFVGFKVLNEAYKASEKNFKTIAHDINNERPDLIICDKISIHIKFVELYYMKWFEKAKNLNNTARSKLEFNPTHPFPAVIEISASFAMENSVYPNKVEFPLMITLNMNNIIKFLSFLFFHFKFCIKHGFGFFNPLDLMNKPFKNSKMTLVSVFPELQPR